MELLIIAILIISIALFSLQLSFFPHRSVQWIYLAVIALGIYFMHEFAVEQSYISLRESMNNPETIRDFSALVITEALLGCLLSILQIKMLYGEKVKKIWKNTFYFSGIIVFVALFYCESFLFILIRGFDFQVLAFLIALALPSFLLLFKAFIIGLAPEKEIRTELKFFLHILQIILAVSISVIALKLPVKTVNFEGNFTKSLLICSIILIFVALGVIFYKIKFKKKYGNRN